MAIVPYGRGAGVSIRVRELREQGVIKRTPMQIDRPELVAGDGVDVVYDLHGMTSANFPRLADQLIQAAASDIRRYENYYTHFFVSFITELNIRGKTRNRSQRPRREYIAAQNTDVDRMLYGEGNSIPTELGGNGRSALDKAQAIIDMTSTGSPGGYVNKSNPYRVIQMIVAMRSYPTAGAERRVNRRAERGR